MTSTDAPKKAIYMEGICKYFGNFCALDNIDLSVDKGSIHAILGENGAGKTTLMNILYGLYEADSGCIYVNGKRSIIKTPKDAMKMGIGMVHQHFMLVETYTVLENIVLGIEKRNKLGFIEYKKARKEIEYILNLYNFKLDLDAKIQDITVGMQQRIEIVKALYRKAEILILDEPTAVLTPQEIDDLIKIMGEMAAKGKTIIIITHKLAEIMKAAHTCTVIRRGVNQAEVAVIDTTENHLAELMVGHPVSFNIDKKSQKPGEPVLQVNNLFVKDDRGVMQVNGANFKVCSGEILGIIGVDGNGQKEIFECLTQLRSKESGSITLGTATDNSFSKISVIPEDRHLHGLVMEFTVAENLILERFKQCDFSRNGILNHNLIAENAKMLIAQYDIRPAESAGISVRSLSGGNQQKVIIARAISNQPDLLVAMQPTRGLDIGAIEFVHKQIMAERDAGKAILLVSLELDEVLKMADRIAVIYNGKIVDCILGKDANEQNLGRMMTGVSCI